MKSTMRIVLGDAEGGVALHALEGDAACFTAELITDRPGAVSTMSAAARAASVAFDTAKPQSPS